MYTEMTLKEYIKKFGSPQLTVSSSVGYIGVILYIYENTMENRCLSGLWNCYSVNLPVDENFLKGLKDIYVCGLGNVSLKMGNKEIMRKSFVSMDKLCRLISN
jgi:hypothetical protein